MPKIARHVSCARTTRRALPASSARWAGTDEHADARRVDVGHLAQVDLDRLDLLVLEQPRDALAQGVGVAHVDLALHAELSRSPSTADCMFRFILRPFSMRRAAQGRYVTPFSPRATNPHLTRAGKSAPSRFAGDALLAARRAHHPVLVGAQAIGRAVRPVKGRAHGGGRPVGAQRRGLGRSRGCQPPRTRRLQPSWSSRRPAARGAVGGPRWRP